MKKRLHFLVVILLIMNLTNLSLAQNQTEETTQKISLKPTLGFEYFSRTIKWDENNYNSKLKSYLFTFSLDFEIQEGFFLSFLLGYSSNNYNGMIFRQLPFSVELEDGGIGGYLFGGEIKKNIFSQDNYEICLFGQFVYSLGATKNWEIPGLNVEASAEGKPTWIRTIVGPVFFYKGFDYFYPYLFLNFNYLWGTFKMKETIQNLIGSENKEFSGEGLFGLSVGSVYEVSRSLSLKGEASLIPYVGFIIKATYSF